MKTSKSNNEKVVCRPCKEQDNWEIQTPNGKVLSKHYNTKSECMKAAKKMAEEYSCDLVVEDLKDASKQTKMTHRKGSK